MSSGKTSFLTKGTCAPSTLIKLHGIEQDAIATEKSISFNRIPMNRERTPIVNEENHCSKLIEEDHAYSPEKKEMTKFELLTSNEIMSTTMKRLFRNTDVADIFTYRLTSLSKNSAQRIQSNTRNRSTTNKIYSLPVETTPQAGKNALPIMKVLIRFHSNNNICGFHSLNYYSTKSVQKDDCICCQECKTWYNELCVGKKVKLSLCLIN
jgi:hypothetical protein